MVRKVNLNLVIVSAFVLLVVCGPASAVDVNGLVAYWALDEGSGTIAYDSAGDNDGTLYGNAAWTSGQVGGALSFDGSGDYVQVPHDDSLTLISAGTVAAWVNLNDSYRQAIATKQPGTGSGNYYLMTGTSRSMLFGITNGTWSEKVQAITSGDAITNEWTFYVGTFDGNSVNLYENGVLVNSLPNTIIPVTTTAPLYIGRWGNNADWDCGGSIDEVMIFNRALSAAEVEQLYWEVFSDLEIAIMQVEEALAEKEWALEGIDVALEKELVAYEALERLLDSKDYGDLKKSDIIKARQRIHSAMQHQAQSASALERGVEQLGDALEALGVEAEPNEPEPNLVAHWAFDEGSGTVAYDSAGDNDGILVGDPAWMIGQVGGALEFDGDGDYVDCGTTFATVGESTTKTLMAWVKSATEDYSSQFSENGRVITLYRSEGDSCFSMRALGNPATWNFIYMSGIVSFLDSGVAVSANEWTHIALVQDGPDVYSYINGVLQNSAGDATAPTISTSTNADIGGYWGGYGSFFEGSIDEVVIYNRALSGAEVEQLYQSGL